MKKKIAFVEMETHSALLEQWYLLVSKMDQIDFHFFVSQKVYDKLTAIPKEHLTIIPSVSKTDFSEYDGVVVNTLHRDFNDYQKLFKDKKVLCLVHNLNFSLFFKSISWRNIFREKERFTYFLKLYFKEKVASRRKLILGAKQFGVISASALDSIKSNGEFAEKSTLIQMNYCNNFEFPTSDVIEIVMPGNVSNKRKDVDLVFRILNKLKPVSKIHFIFLGKPENDSVLRQLENLKENCRHNISITYYNQFIPWQEYSKVIAKANLLLCPIKKDTSFYWVDEMYGSTKVSGAEADCIYNGKIGLFPESYPKMDWYNWYYSSEENLIEILEKLTPEILSEEYNYLQPFTEKFTFEKVKTELEKQLLNLCD
ncbi:glycosyltransferase family 4 protein [Flavobacterium sp. H122]|uniref:glycosyltransferase family 4 protein n=1 Tax=Flavobacterium sp. H122 TaxID=2529860 RepID=UPI0010AA9179|nr:glycosyltransferase family 4 protein [Flavobacterium sp. H122]